MKMSFIFIILVFVSINTYASSFRCGRTLVKVDESSNALIKKCGNPVRKYSSKETINDHGQRKLLGVSNNHYIFRNPKVLNKYSCQF